MVVWWRVVVRGSAQDSRSGYGNHLGGLGHPAASLDGGLEFAASKVGSLEVASGKVEPGEVGAGQSRPGTTGNTQLPGAAAGRRGAVELVRPRFKSADHTLNRLAEQNLDNSLQKL